MRKILFSLLMITMVVSGVVAGTSAYFSDTETSTGNSFTAGSLDLNVDGGNENVSVTYANMKPGSQPNKTYLLENVGSIDGYLDLENIVVTSYENVCLDPETDDGDITCGNPGEGKGELGDVLDLRLMVDLDCNGWLGAGDVIIWQGMASGMPASFDQNVSVPAGGSTCINLLGNWWSTPDDNKAQSDSLILDIEFELGQNAAM